MGPLSVRPLMIEYSRDILANPADYPALRRHDVDCAGERARRDKD
jgi:hypothetical protein